MKSSKLSQQAQATQDHGLKAEKKRWLKPEVEVVEQVKRTAGGFATTNSPGDDATYQS
jgi:hypothetical protein